MDYLHPALRCPQGSTVSWGQENQQCSREIVMPSDTPPAQGTQTKSGLLSMKCPRLSLLEFSKKSLMNQKFIN